MKKKFAVLLLITFFVGLLGSGFSGNSNAASSGGFDSWPMFHNDLTHSGYTAQAGPLTNQTLWSYSDDRMHSSPTIASGVVYVGTYTGKLLALNASNGAVIWSYQSGGDIHSTPAISDNMVYFGSYDNSVYALDASSGALVWRVQTNYHVGSSPAVANGVVYIASSDANVYALNATDGRLIWSFATHSGDVGASPAVVNGKVYISDNGGNIWAMDAFTGQVIWKFSGGDTAYSSPAVVNGVVYVGADTVADGAVYALDASTGAKLWSFSTGNLWVYSSPAVANGMVYVGSYDHIATDLDVNNGLLYALNASTGKMLWSYPIGTEVLTSPIVADNVVYAGGYNSDFYALNASNGAKLWSYQIEFPSTYSWSTAAIAGGVLYVDFEGGTLFAFESSNSTPTPTPTPSPQTNATVPAQTSNGTVNLALSGNITSAQISNVTIAPKNATTTGLYFTVTGENGTVGYSKITVPKSLVPPDTTPLIFIDGSLSLNQGFTQNADNYYLWYTTHFSSHQISIMFTSTNSSPTPPTTTLNEQSNWLQVVYGVGVAIVVVAIVVGGIYIVTSRKRGKS